MTTSRITHISAGDAPRFADEGLEVVGHAAPSRGSTSVSAWRLRLAPGAGSPDHSLTADEVFLALDGEAEIVAAGERTTLRAGDSATIPAGTEFRIAAVGGPFEAVAVMPAGGEALAGGQRFTPPWAA